MQKNGFSLRQQCVTQFFLVYRGCRQLYKKVHPSSYDEFIAPEGRVEQDNAETTQNTTIQQDRVRAIA